MKYEIYNVSLYIKISKETRFICPFYSRKIFHTFQIEYIQKVCVVLIMT